METTTVPANHFHKSYYLFVAACIMMVLVNVLWKYGKETKLQWTDQDILRPRPQLVRSNDPPGTDVETSVRNKSENKKILFWTTFFGRQDYYFGLGHQPFVEMCTPDAGFTHQNCETTSDRSQLDFSDAVVIHIRNIRFDDLPPKRKPEQVWIFFLLESPILTGLSEDQKPLLNGVFNWTMTYRRDSDVPNGYFNIAHKMSTNKSDSTTQWPIIKPVERRLVVWLVSNCQTSSKREKYVEQLKIFIPIDVYGGCGKKCPGNSSKECLDFVFSNYKFYLAFENSLCNDYVTEKFSNALVRGVVPIVNGGADYNAIAPLNSFINTKDFESPRHLAEYILLLNSNDALYLNYFRWRRDYKVISPLPFCHLCDKLHQMDMGLSSNHKVYEDMVSWWYGKGECETTS